MTIVGVNTHWARPYHGQSKPLERSFKDVAEDFVKAPEFSGCWTGNSPMNKPANYGSRMADMDVFIAKFNDFIIEYNARPGRTGGICNGRSYDEVFEESYKVAQIKIPVEDQYELWRLPSHPVRANTQDGAVWFEGRRYWAPFLASQCGKKVVLRYNPDTLDDEIVVYTLKGAKLGKAERTRPAGFLDAAAAEEHAQKKGEWMRSVREEADALNLLTPAQLAAGVPRPQEKAIARPKVVQPTKFAEKIKPAVAEEEETEDTFTEMFGPGGIVRKLKLR